MTLLGASYFSNGRCKRAHASRANEILVPQFPGNTERVQDVSLRCLTTGPALFDRMDRSGRDVGSFREVILGPSQGLSGCTDAIHGGRSRGSGSFD